MQHLVSAIILILLSTAGLYLSWKAAQQERYAVAIGLVMLAGLSLRVFVAADPQLHAWDERYHALVAGNMPGHWLKPTLYEHPVLPYDPTDWQANHVWVHKQPVTLWLIALSLKVFGMSAFAVRLPSILLSTLAIWLVFDVGRYLFSSRVAYIAALLFAINGYVIAIAAGRVHTDHPDALFQFFILLAVWLSVSYFRKERFYLLLLTGIALGLAVLTKWLTAFIVLPLWLVLSQRGSLKGRYVAALLRVLLVLVVATAVFLPWQWHILHSYPVEAKWEYAYNNLHLYEALEEHEGSAWFHFGWMGTIYGYLVYPALIIFAVQTARQRSNGHLLCLVWWGIPYAFFTVVATKMPAYTLIASPAVVLMMACAVDWLLTRADTGSYRPALRLAALAIVLFSVKYTLERIKPIPIASREDDWSREIKKLRCGEWDSANCIIFNAEHYIEAMFYLDATVYPIVPAPSTIDSLQGNGYKVLVLPGGKF
ncbi:MAG: glycosyltransferase family 39 protein [Flavipsychrobacter sp.]|nr:glycosyltransferase family 39 protein [Flavipsychrobacter sp.]